jgi:riboflavin biosynthesis pyrimidine reductase
MMTRVLQLYPPPLKERPLEGLYLAHDLRSIDRGDRPYVYANFITSLDGRIAIEDETGSLGVPKNVANDRDWRLFQELAVQADLLFTSGRYMREYAEGKAQEILMVYDDARYRDLAEWREARGLPRYPHLAVISKSAEFSIPEALRSDDRRIFVVTTALAAPEQVRSLQEHAEVIMSGGESVDGAMMVARLYERGYRHMYSATGPQVLRLLLAGGVLDRLYLTQTGRVLGGERYATIVEGPLLGPAVDFELEMLHYDPAALDGLGQLLFVYDRR